MRAYIMPDFDELLNFKQKIRKKYSLDGRKSSKAKCPAVLISIRLTPEPEYGKKSENSTPSPLAGSGPGGHKASFRSTKLARRARSFKDDFLGKISQMRGPVGGGGIVAGGVHQVVRSYSPKGRSGKMDMNEHHVYPENKGPIEELDTLWRQIELALKHFRDVFKKQIFLMLPGNGTLILDSVWHINLAVKSSVAADSSSSVTSATQGMYQGVARLIKLCDDVLIDCNNAALDQQNVEEVVFQVEHAVKNLIELAKEKIEQQQLNYKTVPRLSSYGTGNLEMNSQRNSLPDIPLTPRERDILEKTSNHSVRGSHSTESILQDSGPPPKPPLPDGMMRSDITRCTTPPPLPPKKKNNRLNQIIDDSSTTDGSPSILERLSLRSKSPDDSISLLSGSGSLDSMLNMSREEEEIKALMDPIYDYDNTFENHCSDIFASNGSYNAWEESSLSSSISNQANLNQAQYDYHRLSNTDSGIVSSESYRSSYYSKRSSQQSTISTQQVTKHSVNSSSEMVKSESFTQSLGEPTVYHLSVTSQNQKTSSSSSSVVSTITSQFGSGKGEVDFGLGGVVSPPPLPQKTKKKQERQPSPYDNVPEGNMEGEVLVTCRMHQSHQSLSSVLSNTEEDGSKPPPLPVKKRHIMAYMEMFGNCQSNEGDQDFMRHSVHTTQAKHWVQHAGTTGLSTTQSCSFSQISNCSSLTQSHTLSIPSNDSQSRTPSPISVSSNCLPPALPPKQRPRISSSKSPPQSPTQTEIKSVEPAKVLPDLLEHTENADSLSDKEYEEVNVCELDLMEHLTVDEYLVFKKSEEVGPDIRGGTIDALIIQATKATKNGVFTYQEAFLTTYRTFITPFDLICKLIRRYNFFYYKTEKRPRSREAFALMVRVVSDLTSVDLEEELQHKLMNFVQQLICCGELTLAKALRVKHLERHEAKQRNMQGMGNILTSISLTPRTLTLLDFKSEQIAEQMTLLDAELFMKIEIPEVLIWAQEQNEERSPNLTLFTEHFNKMSYWARTKILQMNNKETREKYFLKFIKIMKHLRKINNFNSYLALLSALDSAPIRRLEWQKHVQEGLKEYSALIDSSSSFRAYRQALGETLPPCIPYIGLVLQDLTFVHIGNNNLLPDGMINFSKRWQQFNIVENMKMFKKCTYSFKKNERIIQFFENFDDIIPEDAMWQLSESIKPRGGRKAT